MTSLWEFLKPPISIWRQLDINSNQAGTQPLYGPQRKKTCLRGFANNTGADQPAHPRSLISAFVIRFLERNICQLNTGEISTFSLVSVAEETGLKLASSDTHIVLT